MENNDCNVCGKCKNIEEKDLTQCEKLSTILIYSEITRGV